MAKNREPEPKPQHSEESDDELSSDTGSGSESESELEPEQQTPPPKSSLTQIPNSTNSSDSDESLSGSDSDSDESDPEPEPRKPEPASKTGLTQKPKPNVGVKRGAENAVEAQDGKKAKKIETLVKKDGKAEGGSKKNELSVKKGGKSEIGLKKTDALVKKDGGSKKVEGSPGHVLAGSEDVSKKLFQRVFSEDDEVVVLKGMLDFATKRKRDPVAEIDEFLDFINQLLHSDVTKAQLLNKIKRLKGKYVKSAKKVMKDGHERKFTKQHEMEGYELSKRIWGTVDVENNNVEDGMENGKENGSVMKKCGNTNAGATASGKVEDKAMMVVKQVNDDGKLKGGSIGSSGLPDGVGGCYTYSALEQRIISEDIENIDDEKKMELKKKLNKMEVAELELSAMRWEYMAEKARLIVAAKKAEL